MTDPHLDVKRAILAAALAHAGFDGWSDATLRAAAAEAGVSAGRARLAFPAGAPDLVAFYV
ncbi:MAG: COQ9 family protein, partial [Alphaproteobacteria bacterium]|nr:COQ9 family protein [Alphaproteobacteria bacterium]MDX5368130.1 COQ9 family protein [Alphaproteobacteria bacterium]MDX5462961.1 COQ9 family protein [Alphaproteobacteria bacterium]